MTDNNQIPNADHAPTTSTYMAEVELRLHSELRKSPSSFKQLMLAMEGAFPTDVLILLNRMHDDHNLTNVLASIEDDQPKERTTDLPHDGGQQDVSASGKTGAEFPEPHPLDYDWRFSLGSLSALESLLCRIGSRHLAILGAPSLFLHLSKIGMCSHLYDKNTYLIERLIRKGYSSVTQCDLFVSHPPREYDAVVADPPWYPEHYCAFIDGARECLRPGGKLVISVLPRLTRPSAPEDRQYLLDYACAKGFDLVEVDHSALQYDSPPFEAVALRKQGVHLTRWRTGDIFVFETSLREPIAMPRVKSLDDTDWDSFPISDTIVRIRKRHGNAEDLTFEPASLVGHLYLQSVSRRSPVRASIDLWTSRNLALKLSRPDYVSRVLSLANGGKTYKDAVMQTSIENNLNIANEKALGEVIDLLLNDAGEADHV